MNEHGFVKAVHRHISSSIFTWKINDTYTGGIPDAFYAGPHASVFVEYKYTPKLPIKNTSIVRTTLSTQQKFILNKINNTHTKCLVVIGCGKSAIILLNGEWNTEVTKALFESKAMSFKEVANYIQNLCWNDHVSP